MNITSSKQLSVGNRDKLSRRGKYRSKLRVSEEDRATHRAIKWRADQTPSQLLAQSGDSYVLDNVRWGWSEDSDKPADWTPHNRTTTIDVSKVDKVFLPVEPFSPEWLAGHGLLAFSMKEDGAVQDSQGNKDIGFAVSVEARRPEGTDYSLLEGMKDSFGLIYQVGSLSDQLQKVTRQQGHKFIPFELKLDQKAKEQLARDALEAASQDRLGEWYHTLTNSCYTGAVDLVNGVVPDEQKMARWTEMLGVSRLNTSLPTMAGGTLKHVDLLAEGPVRVLNPDAEMWPENQKTIGKLQETLAQVSRSPVFKPALTLAGGGIGGLAGYALGHTIAGDIGALAGGVLGVLTGTQLGSFGSDLIATGSDQQIQSAESWYAGLGQFSVEEARRRIRNS